MENKINVKIKQCYDTEENYKINNPILLEGQLAYTKDKYGKYKIGDGISHWNDLNYTENIFVGTQKEYEEKNANGEITPGTVVYITDDNDYCNIPIDTEMSEEDKDTLVYNKVITKALRLNNASENSISPSPTPLESLELASYGCTLPAAGAVGNVDNLGEWLSSHRSGFYSINLPSAWYNVISNRHRNGLSDGSTFGMVLLSHLTASTADLIWDRQSGNGWQGQRTLLDSANYSGLATTFNNNCTFKGTLSVSQRATFAQGTYISEQDAGAGTAGFVNFMRIKVVGTYANYPITLEVGGRAWHSCFLNIRFQSVNGTDPSIDSIYKFGDTSYPIYYIKSATSTWDFYIQKNEAWGRIDVKRLHNGIPGILQVTFPNAFVANAGSWTQVGVGGDIERAWKVRDSGNGTNINISYGSAVLGQGSYSWLAGWNGYEIRAVCRDHFLGAKSANGYWGMAQPSGADNVWIRTTTQGIIPYQSGGRGGGHQYLGTDSWYFANSYIDNMYGVNMNLSGKIDCSVSTATHINGAKGINVPLNLTAAAGYNMIAKVNSPGGAFNIGQYQGNFSVYYIDQAKINANTNGFAYQAVLLNQSGNSSFPGQVSAGSFYGNGTTSLNDLQVRGYVTMNLDIKSGYNLNLGGGNVYTPIGYSYRAGSFYMQSINTERFYPTDTYNSEVFHFYGSNRSQPHIIIRQMSNIMQIYPSTHNSGSIGDYSKLRFGSVAASTLYNSSGTVTSSDRNIKKDIEKISSDFAKSIIDGLIPSSFLYKDGESGRRHYGMIAQDVEDLITSLDIDSTDFAPLVKIWPNKDIDDTIIDEEGKEIKTKRVERDYTQKPTYHLRYEGFIGIIIKYIQDLSNEIKEKDQTINDLTNRLSSLEKKVNSILGN